MEHIPFPNKKIQHHLCRSPVELFRQELQRRGRGAVPLYESRRCVRAAHSGYSRRQLRFIPLGDVPDVERSVKGNRGVGLYL